MKMNEKEEKALMRINEWMKAWMKEWKGINERMHEIVNGWENERMDERKKEWMRLKERMKEIERKIKIT